jgi:hypothetical protein
MDGAGLVRRARRLNFTQKEPTTLPAIYSATSMTKSSCKTSQFKSIWDFTMVTEISLIEAQNA